MKKILILTVLAVFAAASAANAQERTPAGEGEKDAVKDAKDPKASETRGKDAPAARKKTEEKAGGKKEENAKAHESKKPAETLKAPAAGETKLRPGRGAPAEKKDESKPAAEGPSAPGPTPAAERKDLAPLQAPKKAGPSGDDAIEEGVALFKAGKYPDSADTLSGAVGQMPNYPRTALLLANSLFAVGNFGTAAGELSRGLSLARAVDKEIKEIKEIWRDYVLLKQRIDGLGRLVEANPEDTTLRLLYGFYYGMAGYREYANKVLRSIPADSDDGPAVAVLLQSKLPKKPWIDLPPPAYQPALGRRPPPRGAPYPPPPPPPPPDITRHLNIGFGFGGNIINGQLRKGARSATEGFGSGRFFIGFLLDKLEIDFNFGWQSLHGELILPTFYGRELSINLYSMGLEASWHVLQGRRARGFDPSVRVGYAFHEMEANDSYYYGDYYYPATTAAVGHGPMAGLSLDYVFAFYPLDITLGLDTFYQVLLLQDDAGAPLDGGSLNIQGKVGFRF